MDELKTPLISIIIPTYNRANFIVKTVESLLSQLASNFEIIIVDDGSTDNTKDVVALINDDRVSYFYKENSERGATRNFGVLKAKGSYINFFDSDDVAYNMHTKEAERMIMEENAKVFHLSYDIKTPEGEITRPITKPYDINRQLINGNLISCNGMFLKKEIALEYKFNETRELSASEDYLLWLEIASNHVINHSKVVTSTIVDHDLRSVININHEELIARKELMIKFCYENKSIVNYYKRNLRLLESNSYSYISLHSALIGKKTEAKHYLKKALKLNFKMLFSKRFFVICKWLLFNKK